MELVKASWRPVIDVFALNFIVRGILEVKLSVWPEGCAASHLLALCFDKPRTLSSRMSSKLQMPSSHSMRYSGSECRHRLALLWNPRSVNLWHKRTIQAATSDAPETVDTAKLSPRQRKLAAKRQQAASQVKIVKNPGTTIPSQNKSDAKQSSTSSQKLKPSSITPSINGKKESNRTTAKDVLKSARAVSKSPSMSPPPPPLPAQHKQHPPSPTSQQTPTWSVFEQYSQSSGAQGAIGNMTNEQLAALAMTWAQEVATQMQSYADAKTSETSCNNDVPVHNNHPGITAEDSSFVSGTNLAKSHNHIQMCAETPFQWWSQLSEAQQQACLSNICAVADECLKRLDSTSGHTTGLSVPVVSSSHDASADSQTVASEAHEAHSLHPLASSRGTTYPATGSAHYAPPVATSSDPDVVIGATKNEPSTKTNSTKALHEKQQGSTSLTQQQHVDIAWSVAHVACSRDPKLCQRIAVLQKALNVPFFIVPMCLPGLRLEWFQEEVKLNRDIIYLDGGKKAIEESRLTGWQSDIGVTFQYSGKEMQPEEGGLSPSVAQVRDVLFNLTGQHYDSVLINLYPDGRAGMRFHADPLYGCWTPETSVVSVGAPRRFVFREATNFESRWAFTVRNGDVCCMFDDCQDRLQHSVVTEKEASIASGRISLVYKQRIPGK